MTSWTRNGDLKKRLEKKWATGGFLPQLVEDEPFEPLRIPLKHPTARELTHNFEDARSWIDHLVGHAGHGSKAGYDIEWRTINHRSLGRNKLPVAVIFPTLKDIVRYVGRHGEAARFQTLYSEIVESCPELGPILKKYPNDVLRHDGAWDRLLSIVAYLKTHPRPMIYIRQLEIPGVDTKFIETHKGILDRLLTVCLPGESVDNQAKGISGFERRFGFLTRPPRIRLRILDTSLAVMGLCDLEMPVNHFINLPNKPRTMFIVENEINGLCFPPFPNALVVFGLGYGLTALAGVNWLNRSDLWYWGDIDTHGFAMLDQIRHYFPHTRSFLMNESTLVAHKDLWGSEPSPTSRDLGLLTEDEKKVYESLQNNSYAPSVRLEQERISFSRVKEALNAMKLNPT